MILQGIMLLLVVAAGWFGPAWAGVARVAGTAIGTLFILGGVALAVRGTLDLSDALTPLPYPRAGASLIQTGIYGRVRHPIYGGIVVGAVGWGLITASIPALGMAVVCLGVLRSQVDPRGGLVGRAFPRLPGLSVADAAAHPLDRLSSRSSRSIASRNGSVSSAGRTSRIESLTP